MEYKCPYCGNVIKSGIYCNVCLQRIDQFRKIWDMSTFYYNKGLEASKNKELSLACSYLQKAIVLYKYHIEARNLLGLAYFEMGQIGSALKEWIISISLEKVENRATYYIEQLQKQPKFLASSKEAIMLYNRSLVYMQQENLDMAVIRLKKAISLNSNLVEARALLALAYMKQEQFYKANEQVDKVLAIDKSHKRALVYWRELSKKKIEQLPTYERDYSKEHKVQANVVLDRKKYHKGYLCYFILGILVMFIMSKCLMLPNEISRYKEEIATLQDTKETLSQQIQTLSEEQTTKVTELESQNIALKEKVASYKEELTVFEQKEKLVQIEALAEEENYEEAAQLLYNVASTHLEEADLKVLAELKESVYPRATERLYSQGVKLYNVANYVEAAMQFETLLQYESTDRIARKTLYYLGQISEVNKDLETAKKYYNKIIAEYPDTSEASKANRCLTNINGG